MNECNLQQLFFHRYGNQRLDFTFAKHESSFFCSNYGPSEVIKAPLISLANFSNVAGRMFHWIEIVRVSRIIISFGVAVHLFRIPLVCDASLPK